MHAGCCAREAVPLPTLAPRTVKTPAEQGFLGLPGNFCETPSDAWQAILCLEGFRLVTMAWP